MGETRSWPLPRPQLCLRQEEQAGAEPPHLPGRADAQANISRAREVPHPEPPLAEAGGDRARQLRVRHQGRRGGKLLTRLAAAVFHKKSLKCPPDSFNPVTYKKLVSGSISGFTK